MSNIFIGRKLKQDGVHLDKKVVLSEVERSTHMQVIGASGTGKSKFLEHMIRSDIKAGNGLCLIDPHGALYDDIVEWCARMNLLSAPSLKDKFVLLDPTSDSWTFGFNPLNFTDLLGECDLSFCVDSMVNACAQVWGGEDTSRTPLLKRCLRATFYALADKNHTLLESYDLVTPTEDNPIREYITDDLSDYIYQGLWQTFNNMKQRELSEHFMSTNNRILEFLSSKRIRRIIGQTQHTLNFREMMDDGKIILINLAASGSKLSDDNSRLLGTLIVNDLFLHARSRKPGSRPFYVYIDECSQYINNTIGRILDEGRKFGLHLILAHQHLAQLKEAGEKVYSSVMTNARSKVIFGGLTAEDARVLVDNVFLGELDLQEGKPAFYRPTVVGVATRYFENISRGQSTTRTRTESESYTEGENVTEGQSFAEAFGTVYSPKSKTTGKGYASLTNMATDSPDHVSESVSEPLGPASSENTSQVDSTSTSEIDSETYGYSVSEGETESKQEGTTEGLEPIYQMLSGESYSLEEQVYRTMAEMVNQRTQHAVVRPTGKPPTFMKTPNVFAPRESDEDRQRNS